MLKSIRTHQHIRTMRSVRTNTGPARAAWPRLQETERLSSRPVRVKSWQTLRKEKPVGSC